MMMMIRNGKDGYRYKLFLREEAGGLLQETFVLEANDLIESVSELQAT